MSAGNVVKTAIFVAIAASRNPAVRAAIRNAPKLLSETQRANAVETTKRAAYNAGLLAGRLMSRDRSSS